MTIAIGILAKQGVVIAADTQETLGSFKLSQSKILIANRGTSKKKAGALAVTGAGSAGHLDCINQEICELFAEKEKLTGKALTIELKAKIKEFHYDHIFPSSPKPSDRHGVVLVIGANLGGAGHLWTTEESTVWKANVKTKGYVAVGMGDSYAREMLDRYFAAAMDVATTATLAAYVMFRVKRTVDGCGDKTQIALLQDGYASYVPQENIQRLESVFDEQMATEGLMLHFVLGSLMENLDDNLKMFSARLQDFRNRIMKIQTLQIINLNAGRSELEQPEYRPEDE